MSQKSHDFVTVNRCRLHHDPQYDEGHEREIVFNLVEYLNHHGKNRELIEKLMECCYENHL